MLCYITFLHVLPICVYDCCVGAYAYADAHADVVLYF